jgi:hypothetical protein
MRPILSSFLATAAALKPPIGWRGHRTSQTNGYSTRAYATSKPYAGSGPGVLWFYDRRSS